MTTSRWGGWLRRQAGVAFPDTPISPDSAHPQEFQGLVDLLLRLDSASREDFLALAAKLVNGLRCSCFLWFHDLEKSSLVLTSYYDTVPGQSPSPRLSGQTLPCPPPADSESPAVLIDYGRTGIQSWSEAERAAARDWTIALVSKHRGRLIGYLQLISVGQDNDLQHPLLPQLAQGLAAFIDRERAHRRAKASTALREAVLAYRRREAHSDPNSVGYLTVACHELREATNAELCLVFRQEPDLSFRIVSASADHRELLRLTAASDSRIAQVASTCRPVRVVRFSDKAERSEAFGTDAYDLPLVGQLKPYLKDKDIRSVLFAPITDAADPKHALAVIVIVNQVSPNRLGRQFSKTDAEILADACDYLGSPVRGTETTGAMIRIAETILTLQADRDRQHAVLSVVQSLLPGVSGAQLCQWSPGAERCDVLYNAGGQPPDTTIPSATREPTALTADPRTFQYTETIRGLERSEAALRLYLIRPHLADHEKLVIRFLCTWLRNVLYTENAVRKQLDDILEIRHAIRGRLEGLNCLQTIAACHNLFQTRQDIKVFNSARFSKAVKRGPYFLRRVQGLLDEARVLIGEMSRQNLRLSSNLIAPVVTEAIQCVQAAAEPRNITITFDNKLTRTSDKADFDLDLMDMLVFNLVDNAVKYSAFGQEVGVMLWSRDDQWGLDVTDIGVHIEPEDIGDFIFQPFTRRPITGAARARPGTGLGLAVARKIARVHGGDVTGESELLHRTLNSRARTTFHAHFRRQLTTAQNR
jgi:signal transduction histidine kinase